jgi:STE24 endopeptidase
VNDAKSSRYHRLRRRTAALSMATTMALLIALLFTGASAALRNVAGGSVALYVLLLAAIRESIAFPQAWYRSFFLERRYGLSAETAGAWLRDHAKASVLAVTLGIAGAEVVYFLLRQLPRAWWAASALIFAGVLVLLARLAPVVLLPLFYRTRPLERESLRDRLVALSQRAGVPVLGVYEWSLGDKTTRANAALVGAGATRRILLSDTLLANYTDDEIEVILAHEMGHHVHGDMLKGLGAELVLLLVAFYAASAAIARWWSALGLTGPADVAGLPLLLLAGGAVALAATPLVNALSRFNERRADRYALGLTRRPASFVSAMKRLAAQNMAEEHPSRAALWLFHSHPPFEQRIRAAQAYRSLSGQ